MKKILTMAVIIVAALQVNAQVAEKKVKPFWTWGADVSYLASANAKNKKDSKPLFAGNGYNAGVAFRYGDRWGITGRLGYASGKTNNKNAQAFANTLVTPPFTARVSGLKTNWSQVNLAVGPSVMIGKNKYKGEISVIGGISTGAARSIKIDRYDAQTFVNTVFEATEKKVKPFWEVNTSYFITKISKGIGLRLRAAYGANGGTFGIQLMDTRGCYTCVCCKICPLGCPTTPTPKGK